MEIKERQYLKRNLKKELKEALKQYWKFQEDIKKNPAPKKENLELRKKEVKNFLDRYKFIFELLEAYNFFDDGNERNEHKEKIESFEFYLWILDNLKTPFRGIRKINRKN